MSHKYEYILALDPSGSYTEGKGTTGYVLINADEKLIETGALSAKHYKCAEEYWDAHAALIKYFHEKYKKNLIVIIEEYILYRERSRNQTNSKMETCRLIGVIQHTCWKLKQDYSMQLAAAVKTRWSDELLQREQIIYKSNGSFYHTASNKSLKLKHIRDAFRHAIHYAVCKNKEFPSKGVKNYGKNNKGYNKYKRSNY